jgi:cysteine desulfurase
VRTPVYLDHAATTPVDPAVARAMMECLSVDGAFANPSSVHAPGRAAAALVERARAQVAALIGAEPREVIFTSGATESNNLVVLGIARANVGRGGHFLTSRLEHKSVLDPCKRLERDGFEVSYLAPDDRGVIEPAAVSAALRRSTLLVSIMQVNNEIGVIEDVAAIGEICRARGIAFHTDAAQSVGRIPVDVRVLPIDFLSLTSHKIYGPKGIGALYMRQGSRALLRPLALGGGQEEGLRPGTLPTHQIVGFGVAAEEAAVRLGNGGEHLGADAARLSTGGERLPDHAGLPDRERLPDAERLAVLRDRLRAGLERLGGTHLNGARAPRVPHILNVSFDGVDGESLIAGLGSLAVSTGSACSSASGEPSYVLRALGRSTRLAEASLRFSLGRWTTAAEIDYAIAEVCREVTRLRRVSPGNALSVSVAHDGTQADAGAGSDVGAGAGTGIGARRPGARHCNTDVEWLFRELPGAGVFPEGAGTVLHGEAGGPGGEVWVRFHLLMDGDIVKDARFEARGCPHTLATAAWLTAGMPGRHRGELPDGDPHAWARALAVPVEKLGRLLVIEDALQATLRNGPRRAHHE